MTQSPTILYFMDYCHCPENFWINGVEVFYGLKEIFGDEILSPMPDWEFDESANPILKVHALDIKEDNMDYILGYKKRHARYFLPTALIEKSQELLGLDPNTIQIVIVLSELNNGAFKDVFNLFPQAKHIFASMFDQMEGSLTRWSKSNLVNCGFDKIDLINASDIFPLIEKYRLEQQVPSTTMASKTAIKPRL